jgi:glycosyltransferase involved in cell wall biosynthesis
MFINPGFPAQFGTLANQLATEMRWPTTFVTTTDTRHLSLPFSRITYSVKSPSPPPGPTNPGNLQLLFEHMQAVYEALKARPQVKPDLVVGHMFYGTMLYLRNLYHCPFVGYFDWLPPPFWSEEFAFRPEFPPPENVRLLHSLCHTFKYLHMHAVDAIYTPTHYQLSTLPQEMRHKARVVFDGMDTNLFQRRPIPRPAHFRGLTFGPNTKIVTFASHGLESVRGFDIFMKMAKRIYRAIDDVVFLIAGKEETCYGHERYHLGNQSFKQYVLSRDDYDLKRFHFFGWVSIEDLITLFSLSDLHVYLTVPFILSWSLVEAMSAECTILGSATPSVQEAIDHGVHGLLADFYDVDGLTGHALDVLRDPQRFRHLGAAARARVQERYETKRCLTQLVKLFEEVAAAHANPATRANPASGL